MDNTIKKVETEFKDRLMKKIPYVEGIFGNVGTYELYIDDMYEASRNIVLSLKYPFVEDYSEMVVPEKYRNWQFRCCLEIYRNLGKEGITRYSENGLSWSRLTDGLSQSLINEIIPHVGVPASDEEA